MALLNQYKRCRGLISALHYLRLQTRSREVLELDVTPLKQSVGNIGAWADLRFFSNGQFDKVCRGLTEERRPVWPEAARILRAFELVQPRDVRVVLLGQDPYPQPNRAVGLVFAVPAGQMPPRGSLPNIRDKLCADPGVDNANQVDFNCVCNLEGWARQGVLLLNTALTVPEGQRGGHGGIGWSPLITQTLQRLAPRSDIAWFLCGYKAKRRVPRNLCPLALVIRTGHPSRKHLFDACRPFSRINDFLGDRRIDWWQS